MNEQAFDELRRQNERLAAQVEALRAQVESQQSGDSGGFAQDGFGRRAFEERMLEMVERIGQSLDALIGVMTEGA